MASSNIGRWVNTRTAQGKFGGGQAEGNPRRPGPGRTFRADNPDPASAATSNPYYIGPSGTPVPRWLKDAIGRLGKTAAYPSPAAVPPDATLNPRPTFIPNEGQGWSPAQGPWSGIEPSGRGPWKGVEPEVFRRIREVEADAASGKINAGPLPETPPEPAPWMPKLGWETPPNQMPPSDGYQRLPMPNVPNVPAGPRNPMLDWYENQQKAELENTLRKAHEGGITNAVPLPATTGSPAPPRPLTIRQAYNVAEQRMANRRPFQSRLG